MKDFIKKVLKYLRSIIHISDEIDYENASISIRKNIAFRGTTVMGPIMGFGLGLGTQDNELVKNALKNFAVMVAISIIASSLFFILSPLSLANPSELLARTRPTIYDVFIALFGGFAGIIETSRKDKGTVIAGVAIATALMPPLCTVGYGISIWNWSYAIGALYLFTINSIFIALATFAAVKYFRFPVMETSGENKKLSNTVMYLILIAVIVPSVITAISVVKENNFMSLADKVVSENRNLGKCFIYDYKAEYSRKSATLDLFLAGETLTNEARERLYQNAEEFGIKRSQIVFHEDATSTRQDLSETEIIKGIYEHTDQQIKQLNDSINKLEALLSEYKSKEIPVTAISKELFAQYPNITNISLTRGSSMDVEGIETEQIMVFITSTKPINAELHDRIERWLKVRLENENVLVVVNLE